MPVIVEKLRLAGIEEEDAGQEIDAGQGEPVGGVVEDRRRLVLCMPDAGSVKWAAAEGRREGKQIVVGSIYGYLVSLAFAEYPPPSAPGPGMLTDDAARRYGVVLAATAFTSALAGSR